MTWQVTWHNWAYEDFGAVGDGKTNDFYAIKKAHDYANEHHIPVVTDPTKTYYISDTRIDGEVQVINVMTNVSFGETHFIIDDSAFVPGDETKVTAKNVFQVVSEYPKETVTDREILSGLDGIGEGTTKLDLALGYPALIIVYDSSKHVYGRSGASFKGTATALGPDMHEVLLIDGEGNIDESTPFIFEYKTVSKLDIIRTDIEHLTIEGGVFTTIAAHGPDGAVDETLKRIKKFPYVNRGFGVSRSFTTVKGMRHYVTGDVTTKQHANELKVGAHYHGFFAATYANEVVFEDCVLTGRRYYKISGTYDFTANHVNVIRLKNCTQSNFYVKTDENDMPIPCNESEATAYSMSISPLTKTRYCWGIGGTNFCKNMEYIGSTLSRFDAHQGLLNGKIIDTTINFISLTGKGKMIVENVDWKSVDKGEVNNTFVFLRGDYGSTWEGDVIAKNIRITAAEPEAFSLVHHSYGNFEYGYICHVPSLDFDSIVINGKEDGATVPVMTENKSVLRDPALHLSKATCTYFEDGEGNLTLDNHNPVAPPEYFKIKNSNYRFVISDSDFFKNTDLCGVERISAEEYKNGN